MKCTKCGVDKDINMFSLEKNGTYRRKQCKECRNNNKKYCPVKRRNQLLNRMYGMSTEDYEKKLKEQDYSCIICKKPHDESYTKGKLFVDHNHETGRIRDLLCSACNLGLGKFQDNPELLRLAADYLKRHND